jgi:GNAT superfamily N-acetyltransferase
MVAQADRGVMERPEGLGVCYRPIEPGDAHALQRLHGRLSQRSVYLRFLLAKPLLSDRKAGYFTHVDGQDRFALLGTDPGRESEIIAVARFDSEGDTDRAEYAAAVEVGWQGRGLGIVLTGHLIEAAMKRASEPSPGSSSSRTQ